MPSSGASGGSTATRIASSTNAVTTGAGRLRGISGSAVITVYDSLTQAGSIIAETTSTNTYQSFGDEGVSFLTGLSVTSTSPVVLHYVR